MSTVRTRPPRTTAVALPTVALLAALLAALLGLLGDAGPAHATGSTDPVATPVDFTGAGGTVLHGLVLAPPATADGPGPGPGPGLVMVAGGGPGPMGDLRSAAEAYARRGITTLIYDKRTDGYSTTHRDYGQLADDALAGVRLLRSRPEVAPDHVGLWGFSEGAWVVSLAATRSSDVAYLVTAGAVGLTPARQQAWAYDGFLHHAGVSGSLRHALSDSAVRRLADAGLFPEAHYDPVPVWERVHQPVLAEWGALDREAAPEESAAIIRQALDRAGNTHYTLRTVPGVRHDLHLTRDDGYDHLDLLPANYAETEAAWIHRLTTALPTASADPAPHQDTLSRPLAPLPWYGSSGAEAVATLLCLAGFTGYVLTGAARRIRRRPRPAALPRAARWAAVTGTAALLGALGYLFFLGITAAVVTGPVLFGRPVVWLAVQLLALVAVGSTAVAAVASLRRRAAAATALPRLDRARLGALLLAGAAFLPWALSWGLLVP
ncbi:S9 family peptidase [Kitasatospora sp. SUK 42]|uniref:alpha/beta hydrolase family protein n=1 Tax=Kitasatospora sp. SUK 42 TaxID=1588882 RepID=UPI001C317864|nr:prolyl oligopeptidase family serine peptidase [Kitasatospora sp. SUK 42]MBV2152752.1 lysophospholipase [Kitasatospora sp. SUK 42]